MQRKLSVKHELALSTKAICFQNSKDTDRVYVAKKMRVRETEIRLQLRLSLNN